MKIPVPSPALRNPLQRIRSARAVAGLISGLLLAFPVAAAAKPDSVPCSGRDLPEQGKNGDGSADKQPDLYVTGKCTVDPGDLYKPREYYYGYVNIVKGGELVHKEGARWDTDFWASSIIIENEGKMSAGENTAGKHTPFGAMAGRSLTVHIYGDD